MEEDKTRHSVRDRADLRNQIHLVRRVWDAFRNITVIHALVEGNLMRGISLLSVPSLRTSGHAYGTIMVSADGLCLLRQYGEMSRR